MYKTFSFFGNNAQAKDDNTIAIGLNTNTFLRSIAIVGEANAYGNSAVSIGADSSARANGVALRNYADANSSGVTGATALGAYQLV